MQGFDSGFITNLVETTIPFHKFLAVELLEIRKGYAKIKIPFREEVVGDFRKNQWHSGIIATVMNSAGAIAGISHLKFKGSRISTIDLQVDFLRSAKAEALIVEGEVLSFGDNILKTVLCAWQGEKKSCLPKAKVFME